MTYPLLDHCNRRNAAELARGDLDARPLMSDGWAPPREWIWTRHAHFGDIVLGWGARVSCGDAIASGLVGQSARSRSKEGQNVCRPFNEAQMEANLRFVWEYCGDEGIIDANGNEVFWRKRIIGEASLLVSKQILSRIKPLQEECNDPFGDTMKDGNESAEVTTPPSHGHGAACWCAVNSPLPRSSRHKKESDVEWAEYMSAWKEESAKRRAVPICQWCADSRGINTGRVICDDERDGRVSPSHAAGGYAEYMRKNHADEAPSDNLEFVPNGRGGGNYFDPDDL